VRRIGKAGHLARAGGQLRRRPAPGGARPRLGQGEVHDAVAVAVHPQCGDQLPARIDDGDGMALAAAERMGDAAGDDRLRGRRIEAGRRRLGRRATGKDKKSGRQRPKSHGPDPLRMAHRRQR